MNKAEYILVSVIIPFYKNKEWLRSAIDSAVKQTYKQIEIIVINDGSPENIDDIIYNYQEKLIYFYQTNSGPASARNKGIKISKGDYIAFLDSDDLWKPNKVEMQLKGMIKNDFLWSHSSYELFSESKELIKTINLEYYDKNIFPLILTSCKIATPTIMIKREVLDSEFMMFDETQRFGQDSLLWIKISARYPIYYLSESLVKVRIRTDNAAKRADVQLRSRTQIWRNIKTHRTYFEIRKIPILIKIGFILSSLGFIILKPLFSQKSKRLLEFLSRILYFVPWVLFKISYFIKRKRI